MIGEYVKRADLTADESEMIATAMQACKRAWQHYPVGAAVRALNSSGEAKIFPGGNIGNDYFQAVLCAEHNAATTAIGQGYAVFSHVSVYVGNHPGGLPCGICRQVIRQNAAADAVLLIVIDENTVRRAMVSELLPLPSDNKEGFEKLSPGEQNIVTELLKLIPAAYVAYSRQPRAAIACGINPAGERREFAGVQIDNASYPASLSAEKAAISAAVSAGFTRIEKLAVTAVQNGAAAGINPIDGESLQVLREFEGPETTVLLVGEDRSVLRSSVAELLPDSFGPECLHN